MKDLQELFEEEFERLQRDNGFFYDLLKALYYKRFHRDATTDSYAFAVYFRSQLYIADAFKELQEAKEEIKALQEKVPKVRLNYEAFMEYDRDTA